MKIQPKSTPWKFWQPLFLRMYVKRVMLPLTPQNAYKRRDRVVILYFVTAFVAFHCFLYDYQNKDGNGREKNLKTILKMNADEAKIFEVNWPTKKFQIIDFDRDDYEHLLENEND